MDLFDIVTQKIVTKKKKNDTPISLIRNLEKIKFQELDLLINIFDNKDILTKSVGGWLSIHYATLNSDFRVLQKFCELYIKHDLSLDFNITENKNGCPVGFTPLDICVYEGNIPNYVILKKFGAIELTDILQVFLAPKFNYKKEKIENFNITYPNNIIFRFFSNDNSNISFFLKNNYIEKDSLFEEFNVNLQEINEFFSKNTDWKLSNEYFRHFEKVAGNLYEAYEKDSFPLEILSQAFFQPLQFCIEHLYQNDYMNLEEFKENKQVRIFLNFIGLKSGELDFNKSIFYDILSNELLTNILDCAKKFNTMKNHVKFNKEIVKLFEFLEPLCFHHKLDNLVQDKEIIKKKNKI